MAEKIAIIGAGIAGLTAARTLRDAGHEITVFEKSGGTGGRLSTRRTEFGSFDHGAQYITAKGTPFRAMLTGLSNVGAVALWEPYGKTTNANWHVGTPGMSGLVKPLPKNIDLKTRVRFDKITSTDEGVTCADYEGLSHSFDRAIIAVPSPQAHRLLEATDPVFEALRTVEYLPCWTSMFAFSERTKTLPDTYRGDHRDVIFWLARDSSKPDRVGTENICVQAGGEWSKENLEMDNAKSREVMLMALEGFAGHKLNPIYAQSHRWRYALVVKALGRPYLASANNRLFAIGDGMLGGRVEAAFESARQLCDHLKVKMT